MRNAGVLVATCEAQWKRFTENRDIDTTLDEEIVFVFTKDGGVLQSLTIPAGTELKLLSNVVAKNSHRTAKPMDSTSWTEAIFTLRSDPEEGESSETRLVSIVFDKHRHQRRIRVSEAVLVSMVETAPEPVGPADWLTRFLCGRLGL